ncbi:hypothetical protein KP509_12G058900 [Ceratopteris richardii]|uniref:Sodium/calcium exchanger membrane region domain-containing protein n=1 Tax=Ceratopteris richardii TaxID=49495 RepID=A0A8T2TPZ4_CERRI|nr:hypothetical protein KP509_12G058900 [Ceratopteris richardii]
MMLSGVLLGTLSFLLLLSFAVSSHDSLFPTRSCRPWRHHQRWLLPIHRRVAASPLSLAQGCAGNPEGVDGGMPSGANIDNHITIISELHARRRTSRHASRAETYGKGTSRKDRDGNGGERVRRSMKRQGQEVGNDATGEDETGIGCVGLSEMNGATLDTGVMMRSSDAWRALGLVFWLALLFYVLGTTASDYFSCTLEKLSDVLGLSPTVAGVTLLAVGNGAPDVFASVVAFASSDSTGSIGFGSVLGSTLFITTVVSGIVALVSCKVSKEPTVLSISTEEHQFPDNRVHPISLENGCIQKPPSEMSLEEGHDPTSRHQNSPSAFNKDGQAAESGPIKVDKLSFFRDVTFLLISVGILTLILLDKKVHLWEAIIYLCIYIVYAVFVWTAEIMRIRRQKQMSTLSDPLIAKDLHQTQEHPHLHYHVHSQEMEAELEHIWDDPSDHSVGAKLKHWFLMFYKYCIQWPLALPRRLTIPVITEDEECWSRKLAVTSCTLAPVFVAAVWSLDYATNVQTALGALGIGAVLGILLGLLAYHHTEEEQPPQKFVALWLAGGFLMSIVWFYLVATELVNSLESLGKIFGISTEILALTVLAWGNSVGDLVADLTLAFTGTEGVQIAISGCYAGPLFNVVVGLGLSLILGCVKSEPDPYLITDEDGSLFYIVGFLSIGLAWALVASYVKDMRLGKTFGIGLIVLYCFFLVVGICYALGWVT